MPKTFFRTLWRFNALAIATCGVIGIFVGLFAAYHIAREVFRQPYEVHNAARVEEPSGTAKPGTAEPEKTLQVQPFSRIPGTPLVYSIISATQSYDFRYSSKEATSTRNYLIYDTASGTSRAVLPDDRAVVSSFQILTPDNASPDTAPLALALAVIDKDANSDGMLNSRDPLALVLTRPDGTGLVRLADGIEEHLGWFVPDRDSAKRDAVALVRQNGKTIALSVDLQSFKITRTGTLAR